MINNKADYGATKGIMICEMGTGDVHMVGSEKAEDGSVHLAFKTTKDPQPINVIINSQCQSYDEFEPELVFIFNKVVSIDSMISMLQDCKTEMLSDDKNSDRKQAPGYNGDEINCKYKGAHDFMRDELGSVFCPYCKSILLKPTKSKQ